MSGGLKRDCLVPCHGRILSKTGKGDRAATTYSDIKRRPLVFGICDNDDDKNDGLRFVWRDAAGVRSMLFEKLFGPNRMIKGSCKF